jgi:hypothetical protein
MGYNWKEILKLKSDSELKDILYGHVALDLDAEIQAASELLDRGFDENIILKIFEHKIEAYKMSYLRLSNPKNIRDYQVSYDAFFWIGIFSTCALILLAIFDLIYEGHNTFNIVVIIMCPILTVYEIFNRNNKVKKYKLELDKEISQIKNSVDIIESKIIKKIEIKLHPTRTV